MGHEFKALPAQAKAMTVSPLIKNTPEGIAAKTISDGLYLTHWEHQWILNKIEQVVKEILTGLDKDGNVIQFADPGDEQS